jgi:hypothetical protein
MNPEERRLRALLAEIDRGLAGLQTTKAATLQKLADLTCPYKVGDIVKAKGWTYTGQDCKIKSIRGIHRCGVYTWKVEGNVLKKDGTPGLKIADWNGEQDG